MDEFVKVQEENKDYYDRVESIIFSNKKHNLKTEKGKVFVVHGRNLAARDALFHFLQAIGLKPIEWSQAIALTNKAAPFVGEILEIAFSNAEAVIVLLTGDDEVSLRKEFLHENDPHYEKALFPQARPNVLFEAGMAFGVHPEKTVLVELGTIKPFSDIAGRHSIKMDNTPEKRHELAERLRTAGCSIDTTGTNWLSAGNFELPNLSFTQKELGKIDTYNTIELDEIKVNILKLLSSLETTKPAGVSANYISESLNLPITITKYHLALLKKSQYIHDLLTIGRPPKYILKHRGRAFLVENKLVK